MQVSRLERRERTETLKCHIHVWECLRENRIGGNIYCIGFTEIEPALTFFLDSTEINTLTYLLSSWKAKISRMLFPSPS